MGMQSYYEIIEKQRNQLSAYKEQIDDTKAKHEESMPIATSSVDASERREKELLTSVEELESELGAAKREKDDRSHLMAELQEQLNTMGEVSCRAETLEKQNQDLSDMVTSLQQRVQELAQEKDRILLEKTKAEIELKEMKIDHECNTTKAKKLRLTRFLVRPWLLLRRQRL